VEGKHLGGECSSSCCHARSWFSIAAIPAAQVVTGSKSGIASADISRVDLFYVDAN
jgi:hypothetical protein